jgi:hypothetical protein
MVEGARLLNREMVMANTVKQAYEEAGFVDVHERVFKMPINAWPKDERLKELGRMWERNLLSGLSGFSVLLFNRAFGRTPAETEVRKWVDIHSCLNLVFKQRLRGCSP